jgi:methyl acetate hydrolase
MSLKSKADAVLNDVVGRGVAPGVVAMVTSRDGTLYEGAAGERVAGAGPAMTADTVFRLASMTKAVTGTAVMQLVEQGRLDLDAPAGTLAPELAAAQVLEGFDDAGRPRLRPAKRAVTLRHLLTHTAGFGYDTWHPDLFRYYQKTGLPPANTGRLEALTAPLVFDPGDRWLYGINIDWAGRLVELATGQRLGAYMKTNIFEPLGMPDTGFAISPAMQARMGKVHRRADGGFTPIDMPVARDPEFEAGGGGLFGTAGDYLKFIAMILNGGTGNGNRVLKAETVADMARNHIGAIRVVKLDTFKPEMSMPAEFFPGVEKTWGLSFMINQTEAPTGRSAGSLAWAGRANTFFWIDPSRGLGGVFMTQLLPFVDTQVVAAFEAFERVVYAGA